MNLPPKIKDAYFYRKLLDTQNLLQLHVNQQLEAQFTIRKQELKDKDNDFSPDSSTVSTEADSSGQSLNTSNNILELLNTGIDESEGNLDEIMNLLEETAPVSITPDPDQGHKVVSSVENAQTDEQPRMTRKKARLMACTET